MFKVGDWVALEFEYCKTSQIIQVVEIDEDGFVNGLNPDAFKLWEPKEGEWCWFWDDGDKYPQLRQFSYYNDGYVTKEYIECKVLNNSTGCHQYIYKDTYDNCEPFIGELPSHVKDKQ